MEASPEIFHEKNSRKLFGIYLAGFDSGKDFRSDIYKEERMIGWWRKPVLNSFSFERRLFVRGEIFVMSFESVLEQQRRYHEERERLMDTMTKEMLRKKATVILSCQSPFFILSFDLFSIVNKSIRNIWWNYY